MFIAITAAVILYVVSAALKKDDTSTLWEVGEHPDGEIITDVRDYTK